MKKFTLRIVGCPITKTQVKYILAIVMTISSLLTHYSACQPFRRGSNAIMIESYFTPEDPCTDIVVSRIRSAKQLILVQAYVLTSLKIVQALLQAHRKKVTVQILIDKNALASYGSKVNLLLKQGIPIIIDKTAGLAHSKTMIIDDLYVITGSFNWTHSAQSKNTENLIIITGAENNKQFKENWYKRATAGERLTLPPIHLAYYTSVLV